FGFEQDAPATRPAAASIEWTTQGAAEPGTGIGMLRSGPGRGVQVAVDNLGNERIRNLQQVLIRCRSSLAIGLCHRASLACGFLAGAPNISPGVAVQPNRFF